VALAFLVGILCTGPLGLGPGSAVAQPAGAAGEALRAPDAFLGYELGTRFTPHHRVVDYVRHVAAQSPAVTARRYGTTYEGRPLVLATVTAPDNHDRLEALRRDNLRRAGMLEGEPQAEPTAVAWLSYNVHGNESVSAEAALKTLHTLATADSARAWLNDTVVLIDPTLNPDGRERYVQWYKRTVGRAANPRPDAREHHEPWPGGRSNHYYFDLNRDWAWGVQRETRARLDAYHRWMPHIHVDFHEQGVDEPYYFPPAAKPFHENITDWQREFQFTVGRNHASYFDRNDWLYFTQEVFDLFYPGYGDTWPLFNGAIGMTYEQGGSGRAGRAVITAEGDTLTLGERIAHHFTTGLSTVEVAAENHERLVREFTAYYRTARQDPPGKYRTYVLQREAGGDRLRAIAEHLDQQRIRYGTVADTREVTGMSYAGGGQTEVTVEPGDLVVRADQPKARLAKVLLEPKTTIVDSLTYDITAWGLPYAYGVDAVATEARLAVDTTRSIADPPAATAPDAGASPYAYLVPWSSRADVRFAAELLQEGVLLRFAEEPIAIDGRSYDHGALVVTRNRNEHLGDFDATVRQAAEATGQPLHAVQTGFTDEGPDFGSANVGFVEAPHVATLAGEPLYSGSVGEVWHFFDQKIRYPVTLLPTDEFAPDMLDDVDVLVMPSGRYDDWLSKERLRAVADWVRGGGRLVAIDEANDALVGRGPFALTRVASGDADADSVAAGLQSYGAQERERLSGATPGSIHRAQIDTTHPLGFGVSAPYFTLKRSDDAFAPLDDGWNVAVLDDARPVSGFMGQASENRVEGTLTFGVQSIGRGEVAYLIDNPLFRGFWYSGEMVFSNAVFLVGNN
jgi:hypothetical protein